MKKRRGAVIRAGIGNMVKSSAPGTCRVPGAPWPDRTPQLDYYPHGVAIIASVLHNGPCSERRLASCSAWGC